MTTTKELAEAIIHASSGDPKRANEASSVLDAWALKRDRDMVDAVDYLFAQRQGHCPNELYEDGYSDACADAKAAIKRLAVR